MPWLFLAILQWHVLQMRYLWVLRTPARKKIKRLDSSKALCYYTDTMIKAPEIITNLIEGFGVTKETLAGKMGVSVFTIVRWQQGKTNPAYAEIKLLNQICRGYRTTLKRRK